MKRLLLLSLLLHLIAAWLLDAPVPDIPPTKAGKTYSVQLKTPSVNTAMTVTDIPVTPPAADVAPQKPLPEKAAPKPPKPLASPRPATVSEPHSVAPALPKKEDTTSNEQHHVKPVPPAVSEAPQRGVSSSGEEDRQQNWLDALHARISAHQRYPTRARRRGQEGRITVNLSIDRTGYLMDAVIVDGKRVFHQPTLRAIQAALPLPPPNGPEHITLTINYRLEPAVSAL